MRHVHGAALAALLIGCGGVDIEDDGRGDGETNGSGGASSGATAPAATASTGTAPAVTASSTSTGPGSTTSASTGQGGAGDGGAGGDGSGASGVGGGSGGAGTGGADACELACGANEICGGVHAGIDDDCDGDVDETCACTPGETSFCFEGDPSYLDVGGCFAGTMTCTAGGTWGACFGGRHPIGDDSCVEADEGCHAISAWPYQTVDLHAGLGGFGDDAESEAFDVACPEGAACPGDVGGDFQGFQAGRYEVTYTKVAGGEASSCTFPLDVVGRGLRVELSWPYEVGADLDLHLMQPDVVTAFDDMGTPADCTWNNCTITAGFPTPEWFPLAAAEGDPVAWYLADEPTLNSCYFGPRGRGTDWVQNGQGCHNPRMEVDNIVCDPAETNPADNDFCAAENTNIDFPPLDQWMRLAVVHFSGATAEPTLRVFCDGELAAELGPEGYATDVSLSPADDLADKNAWLAADVAFVDDGCGGRQCVVRPIHLGDAEAPWIGPVPTSGPPHPPLP